MRFSQRVGLAPATKLAQRESMDEDLRSSIWSLLTLHYWNMYRAPNDDFYGRSDYVDGSNLAPLITSMWLNYFKKPVDTIDQFWEHCLKRVRDHFFAAKWFQVYDFVEFVVAHGPPRSKDAFVGACNIFLARENSAYRLVGDLVVEITSEQEIAEVDAALAKSDSFGGARTHLTSALALLSNKSSPDYRNSIKESISAVESVAKQLSTDSSGTLGAVLSRLEKAKKLHPALRSAFSSLYGYTSDANGIRHALLDEPNLTKADARFMIICCSAFINYAIETTGT